MHASETIAPVKMPTLLRRSKRPSLPNNDVIIRRSFIRDIYAKKENAKKHKIQKTAKNGTIKNGLVRKQKVQRKRKNKTNPEQPSQSNCAKACDNIKMSPTSQSAIEDSIKKENQDDEDNTTEDPGILEPFVVTKAIEITWPEDRDIHPTFFPSEAENSGIIVFKSHSRKAVLNISFAKCFVVLNGTFSVDDQGLFNVGDFIKAPAGSKLSIKYLGDSDTCGKIIFFKSVN